MPLFVVCAVLHVGRVVSGCFRLCVSVCVSVCVCVCVVSARGCALCFNVCMSVFV